MGLTKKIAIAVFILLLLAFFLFKRNQKGSIDLSNFNDKTIFNYKELSPTAKVTIKEGKATCFMGDLDAANFDTRVKRRRSFLLSVENLITGKSVYSRRVLVKSKEFSYGMPFSVFEDGAYGVFLCSGNKAPCLGRGRTIADINKVLKGALDKGSNERRLTKKELVYSGNIFLKKDKYIIATQYAVSTPSLIDEYKKILGKYFPNLVHDKSLYANLDSIHSNIRPGPLLGPGLPMLKNEVIKDNRFFLSNT